MVYIFILFVILTVVLSSPKVKGIIGESSALAVLKLLDKEKYVTLYDLMVRLADGKTTQIDHLVISTYGIFVIEMKNYKGWITGKEDSQYWTQTIYKRKEKLYNPIKQNRTHVKAIQELLTVEYPTVPVISIVVFSTRADLKVNVTSEVVYTPQLLRTIKKYDKEIITFKDVEKLKNLFLGANILDKKSRKEHVTNINNKSKENHAKIRNGICPWCGGQLLQRNGKYGKFFGCSHYPKCKFRHAIAR